ncbi:hypothetical protein [Novipirellula sp.]|uniref:hypothetical protein n=1 Tax=Novipirellula sp. TaxID=2795430 RepID=UPI003568EB2F
MNGFEIFRSTLAVVMLTGFVGSLSGADTDQLIRSTSGSGNLYEKLIVQSSSAVYVKEPTLSSQRIPVPAFSVYYRLQTGTSTNEQNGYYKIGKRNGETVGWIKKEFVASWNTRFGIEPALPQPDRHFTVFRDADGKTPHIEFVGKEGQIPDGAKRFALIVDSPSGDVSDDVFPVIVFTGDISSSGAKEKEQMALYNLQFEVVFVVASTFSMETMIEAVREVTDRAASQLRQMPEIKPVVHFGLVEYRDSPPNGDFAAKVRCRLTDGYDLFTSELKAIQCSSRGEDDWPDDVVAGIDAAIREVGWRPNSSKHVILLGDCPAKNGYDPVTRENLQSITRKSLEEILAEARPLGGSDSERAQAAKNFHAVCNNHESPLNKLLNGPFKDFDPEAKTAMTKLFEDAQIVQAVRDNPNAVVNAFAESFTKEAAVLLVNNISYNDTQNRWREITNRQFRQIASNQDQLQGFYASIDTYRSPSDKDRAITGLVDILSKAYQALAVARDGGASESSNAFQGNMGAAIYQIVGTKGDTSGVNQVELGYAGTRDANGRLVGTKRVMVFKEELMRLFSILDSLHTTFKNKANKADRQNVADILEDLKRAIASQVAGQEIDENVNLTNVIQFDFPLKTPALEVSAQEIAVMTTPAFNNWLESLGTARDRAKSLVLGGKTDWTTMNNEDSDQFTFLALSELP